MTTERDGPRPGLTRRVSAPLRTVFDAQADPRARRAATVTSILGLGAAGTAASVAAVEIGPLLAHQPLMQTIFSGQDIYAAGGGAGLAGYAFLTTAVAVRLDRDPVKQAAMRRVFTMARNLSAGGTALALLATTQAAVMQAPLYLREDLLAVSFFGAIAAVTQASIAVAGGRQPRPQRAPSLSE